jgi:hypothetical protein
MARDLLSASNVQQLQIDLIFVQIKILFGHTGRSNQVSRLFTFGEQKETEAIQKIVQFVAEASL